MKGSDSNWFQCLLCHAVATYREGIKKHLAREHDWDPDHSIAAIYFYRKVRPCPEMLRFKLPRYKPEARISISELSAEELERLEDQSPAWGPTICGLKVL